MPAVLGMIPFQQFRDRQNQPNVFGKLFTYNAIDKETEVPLYKDAAMLQTYEYPLRLDGTGGVGEIYFDPNINYYGILTDVFENKIAYFDNYNPASGGGNNPPITISSDIFNSFKNGQFGIQALKTDFNPSIPIGKTSIIFAPGNWEFEKSNTSVVDNLSIIPFFLGQDDVPYSPFAYVRYQATNINNGSESYKRIQMIFHNVRTFEGQKFSMSVWARGNNNGSFSFNAQNYFGTGGTPSEIINTEISAAFEFSTTWKRYSATFDFQKLNSKTIGTNKDDCLKVGINLPLNQIGTFDFTNFYLQLGSVIIGYPIESLEDIIGRIGSSNNYLPIDEEKVLTIGNDGIPTWASGVGFPIGGTLIWSHPENTIPPNFIISMGQTIHKVDYPALFKALNITADNYIMPDRRGTFIRGMDKGRGLDPGRAENTLQFSQVSDHVHLSKTNAGFVQAIGSFPPVGARISNTGNVEVVFVGTTGGAESIVSGTTIGAETRPVNYADYLIMRVK